MKIMMYAMRKTFRAMMKWKKKLVYNDIFYVGKWCAYSFSSGFDA